MEIWPTLAPQIPYSPGSSFFHSQEKAFFSCSNESSFQVRININLPNTNQTLDGPYRQDKGKAQADPLQLSAAPRQQPQQPSQQPSPSSSSCGNISPPSQHQSPSKRRRTQAPSQPTKPHHSQMIPLNPLPVAASLTNSHHTGQYLNITLNAPIHCPS